MSRGIIPHAGEQSPLNKSHLAAKRFEIDPGKTETCVFVVTRKRLRPDTSCRPHKIRVTQRHGTAFSVL
jgi:hypothetical protein